MTHPLTNFPYPPDRNGKFEPQIIARYTGNTNKLKEKILAIYAKGMSARYLAGTLAKLYGVDISAAAIGTITYKVRPLVEAWQNRPLARIYPIVNLDDIRIKLR